MVAELVSSLELAVSREVGRHTEQLATQAAGNLLRAAESLAGARSVDVLTGTFMPEASAAETDGPPGAVALAAGLTRLGIEAVVVTDERCAPVIEAAARLEPVTVHPLERPSRATHIVAVEVLGPAADGIVHNFH